MVTIKYIGEVSDWNRRPIFVGKNLAAKLVATGNWAYCEPDGKEAGRG